MKKILCSVLVMVLALGLVGCSKEEKKEVTLTLAAAASLETSFEEELIPLYQKEHENVKIQGTYDSSGKLQLQIEQGLKADVFFSAADKQMDALIDEGYIKKADCVELLRNEIVLITQKNSKTKVKSFKDLSNANMIAIGDPESVPAGTYAKEALSNMNVYSQLEGKLSLATNVTEVLSWVENGSCEVGIVYATDAKSSDKVKILDTCDEKYLNSSINYPVAVLKKAPNYDEAKEFLNFLQTKEAKAILKKNGFSIN